jgi:hypothetical protein
MPMLNHELLRTGGILIVRPEAPLESRDFQMLAQEIDPYIEANGKLNGFMIDAASFPGWKDFEGLLSHLKFLKDHHRRIQRVAVVSDSSLLTVAPRIATHFVQADIRHFSCSQREEAFHWLRGTSE